MRMDFQFGICYNYLYIRKICIICRTAAETVAVGAAGDPRNKALEVPVRCKNQRSDFQHGCCNQRAKEGKKGL